MEIFLAILFFVIAPVAIFTMIRTGRIGRTSSWRSLFLCAGILIFIIMAVIYIGAAGGNRNMDDLLDFFWSWNPLPRVDGGMQSSDSIDSVVTHFLVYWAVTCPVFLSIFALLIALEYLDAQAGLALVERLKKLLWK